MRHLGDLESYADGLQSWLRGDDSAAADAAGMCVAEVLTMIRQALRDDDG